MEQQRAAAVLIVTDSMFISHRARLAHLALKHGLPSMYGVRNYVEEGGLVSYGPNIGDLYYRAAVYVDKILKGAKPGSMPVEQPMKFELVINLKTAKALDIAIPQPLLLRVDEVIR